MSVVLAIQSELQVFEATRGSWHYVILPERATAELLTFRQTQPKTRHTPSRITISDLTWNTNLIPDKERGWLFVIKAEVRKQLGLSAGDPIEARIELIPN